MAGKIIIDRERCKGCGLCVQTCPHDAITVSRRANQTGYFPSEPIDGLCTGCTLCAIVCPDTAIQVFRDRTEKVETGKKTSSV